MEGKTFQRTRHYGAGGYTLFSVLIGCVICSLVAMSCYTVVLTYVRIEDLSLKRDEVGYAARSALLYELQSVAAGRAASAGQYHIGSALVTVTYTKSPSVRLQVDAKDNSAEDNITVTLDSSSKKILSWIDNGPGTTTGE